MSHVESGGGGGGGIPVLSESEALWGFLFAPMNLFLQGLFGILGLL